MATKFEKDEHLEELGRHVIESNDCFRNLRSELCRIAYQKTSAEKKSNGKVVYADTEKVKDKLKGILPYDFIITFYGSTKQMTDEKLEKLMYHELHHVGFSDGKYYIVPHDVEDFKEVIDLWGINWIQ